MDPLSVSSKLVSQNVYQNENKKPISLSNLFFSLVWTFTAGAIMSIAVDSRVSWLTNITFPLPLLSLLIPNCLSDFPKSKEKVIQFALSQLSFETGSRIASYGIGIATPIIANHEIQVLKEKTYTEQVQNIILSIQGALLFSHFVSRLVQVYCVKDSEKIDKTIKQNGNKPHDVSVNSDSVLSETIIVVEQKKSKPKNLSPEKENLLLQTEDLKKSNQLMKDGFEKINNFLITNKDVLTVFNECYDQTKNILLSPYEMDDSDPVNDPIVEDWRKESQLALYYEAKLKRMLDFLEKNSTFASFLKEKMQNSKDIFVYNKLIFKS